MIHLEVRLPTPSGDQVYLWGANNQGQLGVGGRQSAQPEPQLVELGPVRQAWWQKIWFPGFA